LCGAKPPQKLRWTNAGTCGGFAPHKLLIRFLTDGYDLKSVADYGIGPDAVVSADDANQAIETANRFVDCIQAMLSVP